MPSCDVRRRTYSLSAFTLTELLVVLGIVGLLAALLLPLLSGARESARITTCSSNLRQLGIAVKLYEDDYGALPTDFVDLRTTGLRDDPLQPYVRDWDLYHCPDGNRQSSNDYAYRVFSFLHMKEGRSPKLLFPSPATVVLYCANHLQPRGAQYGATSGVYTVLRDQGSVHRIPAGEVAYWLFRDGIWVTPGQPQPGDSIWPVFPDEPWPPSWRDVQ